MIYENSQAKGLQPKNLPQLTEKNRMRQQISCKCSATRMTGGDNPHCHHRPEGEVVFRTSLETGQHQLPNKAVTSKLGSAKMCYFKWRYNISRDTKYRVDTISYLKREDTKYLITFILFTCLKGSRWPC